MLTRTHKEVKLLALRQAINDCLDSMKQRKVVSIRGYKKLLLDLGVCEELLKEQRLRAHR